MQEESLKNKTAKGLFWSGLGSGIQQIIQLVFGVVMLNILLPENYGIVGMLYIFTALALVMQDGGFVAALINKRGIDPKDYNAVFWFSVFISAVMYALLFFSAPLIASFYNKPELILVSRVLFLSFLIGGIGVAQHAYIMKEIMAKERTKIELWALLISGISGVLFAYMGYAYWAIVIQNVLHSTVTAVTRYFYCPWKPSFHVDFRPLKEMSFFSISLLFTSMFNRIVDNLFFVILGKYYHESQVGFYLQGNKWSMLGGAFINNMMNGVIQPVLSRMTEEKARQRNAFRKLLRFGAFISFPLLFGLGFVAEEFFLIVGQGEKWVSAVPFLQLFCIWYAVNYIWSLYTKLLIAHGKSNVYMVGTIIVGSLQLLVVTLMFPYGVFPMLIAYLSVFFAGLLYWHYFTNKLIGLSLWSVITDIAPYLLTTIFCIFISWLITSGIESVIVRFVTKILITALLYITIMWFSNSVIVRESFEYVKGVFIRKENTE
jgi:Membrane protein involved in the export of O-antigen and teichoic acid